MTRRRSRTYNVHEAKTHLSQLLEEASQGYEVIVARAGVPVVRLVPVSPTPAARPLGTEAGLIHIAEDFDAPLDDDLLDTFER
jgi:prevent-host-death family protein